jgi:hypothetical protein
MIVSPGQQGATQGFRWIETVDATAAATIILRIALRFPYSFDLYYEF